MRGPELVDLLNAGANLGTAAAVAYASKQLRGVLEELKQARIKLLSDQGRQRRRGDTMHG